MRQWGITQGCFFFGERNESRDHLYFACLYTFTLWKNVAGRLLGPSIMPNCDDTFSSVLGLNASKMDIILMGRVFHSAIHMVWRERNSRHHGGGGGLSFSGKTNS